MENNIKIEAKTYQLERYPITIDKSLRAWSNAELLALDYVAKNNTEGIHLFNDRFGVWNTVLEDRKPITVCTYASQRKAVLNNLQLNNFSIDVVFKTPLDDLINVDLALLKIPKSLELFELFLKQIHNSSNKDTEVVCGFMLKYFSSSFLKIANLYFGEVVQTKAWKKARLLILKKPKKVIIEKPLINTVLWKEKELQQYYGVFSGDKIDIGTRFLIENLKVNENEIEVLDLASGNGVLASEVIDLNSNARVTLIDDFNLAIASSKLNIPKGRASFICAENLENLEKKFDLVVSNPPFHFEYENNIEISLSLFRGVKDCLKINGRFLLVANAHLNYKTHLEKLFLSVLIVKSNSKFVIYECFK